MTDNDVVADRPSLVTWVAKDRPYYSGKHKRHGVNLQFIAWPTGDMLLQGSCCELYRRYFRRSSSGLPSSSTTAALTRKPATSSSE